MAFVFFEFIIKNFPRDIRISAAAYGVYKIRGAD